MCTIGTTHNHYPQFKTSFWITSPQNEGKYDGNSMELGLGGGVTKRKSKGNATFVGREVKGCASIFNLCPGWNGEVWFIKKKRRISNIIQQKHRITEILKSNNNTAESERGGRSGRGFNLLLRSLVIKCAASLYCVHLPGQCKPQSWDGRRYNCAPENPSSRPPGGARDVLITCWREDCTASNSKILREKTHATKAGRDWE